MECPENSLPYNEQGAALIWLSLYCAPSTLTSNALSKHHQQVHCVKYSIEQTLENGNKGTFKVNLQFAPEIDYYWSIQRHIYSHDTPIYVNSMQFNEIATNFAAISDNVLKAFIHSDDFQPFSPPFRAEHRLDISTKCGNSSGTP